MKIMSRGFTLIEMLVVLTIVGMITGGGVLYLNRTNSLQKIESAKQELLSSLRFARNLAITNQKPPGFVDNLTQVAVDIGASGVMTAWPNTVGGVGTTYFSKDLTADGVVLTFSPGGTIGFSAYEGRFLGVGNSMVIIISANDLSVGETKQLIITQSGLINDL